jgi:ELWxxDGT repeat protein
VNVRNTISGNKKGGVWIEAGATQTTIAGNFIGLNSAGTASFADPGIGVFVDSVSNITIGGEFSAGNTISGNTTGIKISGGSSNRIRGNVIGTNPAGAAAIPNVGDGVLIVNSTSNSVGGLLGSGRANLISGNAGNGIQIIGATSTANTVQGNTMGLQVNGLLSLANDGSGVLINGAGNNTIGGITAGARNVISGNGGSGVELIAGAQNNRLQQNYIGTTFGGDVAQANTQFGIDVVSATGTIIGGDDDDDGTLDGVRRASNIISGNNGGVRIQAAATQTMVVGNLIGLDWTGQSAVGNIGPGVLINGAVNNTIGGATIGAGNTIAGNSIGVEITSGANNNKVRGNRIGTNITGADDVPNLGDGIFIYNSFTNYIGDYVHAIGTEAGNVISGNQGNGIHIYGSTAIANSIYGNIVGLNAAGTAKIANGLDGIRIESAPLNTIGGPSVGTGVDTFFGRNLLSGNTLSGARIVGSEATSNYFAANWIGIALSGLTALGNSGSGISIEFAPQNAIELGNVISGNEFHGVEILYSASSENRVKGNIIGLDPEGTIAIANHHNGVFIQNASNNIIGGTAAPTGSGDGNIISGNTMHGVEIVGAESTLNKIQGNLIGAASDGTTDRGNREHGIRIEDGRLNPIGGTIAGEGNTIAFNGGALQRHGHGVEIVSGFGNAIRRNSIFSNAGRGIDLGDDLVNINDPSDADVGANNFQNYPFVRRVEFLGANKKITFNLQSTPFTTFQWEFFSNVGPDDSGYGEGKKYLTDFSGSTNVDGFDSVTVTLQNTDVFVSATVTDVSGNTSEFSMVDTDADGLADAWELYGIDVDEDGEPDLILPGANPNHKDVYVEVDAMLFLNPIIGALNDVKNAFASAPADLVDNPDLSPGINLHWENGGDWLIPPAPWNDVDDLGYPSGFGRTKNGYEADHTDGTFGQPADRLSPNWPQIREARSLSYYYSIFADSFASGGASGKSELPGNDFIVTLGSLWRGPFGGTREQQAGTFMHELGHTLGLRHGGGNNDQYKPNYFSVMNYFWQIPQPPYASSWTLDYSREKLNPVSESAVSEMTGFGGNVSKLMPIGPVYDAVAMTTVRPKLVAQGGAIKLNDDADMTDMVILDLNFINDVNGDKRIDASDASPGQTHIGYDDWSNLVFSFETWEHNFSEGVSPEEDFVAVSLLLDSIGTGPGLIQFSSIEYEQHEGAGSATISVARSGGVDGPVSVQYQTVSGGSAAPGADYTTTAGTLNFADGEYIKTFTIPLINDAAYEGDETVQLELLNPSGTTLGSSATAVLQVTEPMLVKFARASLSVIENAGSLAIDVELAGETGQILSEDITIYIKDLLTGSALAGIDYAVPDTTSLLFAAGSIVGATQSFILEVINNLTLNLPKTVDLDLRPVDSFAAVASPDSLTVSFLDDGEPLRLVQDILPGAEGSIVSYFGVLPTGRLADVDGTLYFVADTGQGTTGLWKTDGTAAGATLLITRPTGSYQPPFSQLTNVGGTLYFTMVINDVPRELWKSDGTPAGTLLVKQFSSISYSLTDVGGGVFFTADGGDGAGVELWKSNGSEAGTTRVADIMPGVGTSNSRSLTEMNGTLFFSADDGIHGAELWKSDGNSVTMVKDIVPPFGSFPNLLTNVDGTLYFSIIDFTAEFGRTRLWKSDGSEEGTVEVKNLSPDSFITQIDSMVSVNGMAFFCANTAETGFALWRSDGTEAGTIPLAPMDVVKMLNVNGTLFAVTSFLPHEIWTSDGTVAGTTLLTTFEPLPDRVRFAATAVDDTFFFAGGNTATGLELWKTNGTQTSTVMIGNINPGAADSYPLDLIISGGKVFLTADDSVHGRELWVILPDPPALTGDFNSDGYVDGADFLAWQRGLGIVAPNAVRTDGDADNDMDVDVADLSVWQSQFGTSAPLIPAASGLISPATESTSSELGVKPLSANRDLVYLAMTMGFQKKADGGVFREAAISPPPAPDFLATRPLRPINSRWEFSIATPATQRTLQEEDEKLSIQPTPWEDALDEAFAGVVE